MTLAAHFRSRMPRPEFMLWDAIRGRQCCGLRFRRQVQIGPYYADFVCYVARLIVELDGESHDSDRARRHDCARDEYLRSQNFRVLRFWNAQIFQNLESVLLEIQEAIEQQMAMLVRTLPKE
jgi:very-short-patch-repair endonuclease